MTLGERGRPMPHAPPAGSVCVGKRSHAASALLATRRSAPDLPSSAFSLKPELANHPIRLGTVSGSVNHSAESSWAFFA